MHEPFAAILWYLHANKTKLNSTNPQNFIVFDRGGGTLDITVVRFEKGKLYEISNCGLEGKSGDYFDERIRNYGINEFCEHNKIGPNIFQITSATEDRLRNDAEANKIRLSSELDSKLFLSNFYDKKFLDVKITRDKFEELIQSEIDEAFNLLQKTLHDSKLLSTDIDSVLLIGGSSLIPLIQSKIRKEFGIKVIAPPNANSIIAEGAAIASFYNYIPFLVKQMSIMLYDDSKFTIFEKEELLNPNKRKQISLFSTDNRDGEARLIIYEGDKLLSIMNVKIDAKLPKPYNHERIYSTFEIDENVNINVTAHGAINQQPSIISISDLHYGLRIK